MNLEEMNNRFVDYFSAFVNRHVLPDGRIQYTSEELFERVLYGVNKENDYWTDRRNELYQGLCQLAEKCRLPIYTLLTFELPYCVRNTLIHGSEATLLVADYCQINKVACMNYFMDRFLLEYIPYLFDEKKMKEMLLLLHGLVYSKRQGGSNQPIDIKNREVAKVMKNAYPKEKWLKGKT